MDPEPLTLEEIEACIARCEDCWYDGPCYHCRQKYHLINLACAWAFDLGAGNVSP